MRNVDTAITSLSALTNLKRKEKITYVEMLLTNAHRVCNTMIANSNQVTTYFAKLDVRSISSSEE